MLKTQGWLDTFNASLHVLLDDDLGADLRELFKCGRILFDLDDTGEIAVILLPPLRGEGADERRNKNGKAKFQRHDG